MSAQKRRACNTGNTHICLNLVPELAVRAQGARAGGLRAMGAWDGEPRCPAPCGSSQPAPLQLKDKVLARLG